MSLRIVFSWFADAGAWPEHPGLADAAVDHIAAGPMRLLDHLETMLGLGAPLIAGVKRIAVYRRKLESAGVGKFWSRSFEVDPWSTARELLKWRDCLIEAGWRPGTPVGVKRVADLADAEAVGPPLPAGLADRLRAVIAAMAGTTALPLASVELIDARADLPAGWRQLLLSLEACGVEVSARNRPAPRSNSSDLARLLAPFDAKGLRPQLAGDSTVCQLNADSELTAAEALAGWLAAAKDEEIVFILGKDSAVLDHALHRAGLPRLGASAASPHRALLQVLPLAFGLAWNPPDPSTLLDFLLLPVSPLPRWAANILASRVAETPGVGGPLWQAAFDEIATKAAEKLPDDPSPKRGEAIATWRAWVEPERHDPVAGMLRSAARAIAGRVAAWSAARYSTSEDPLFLALTTGASDLAAAIDATGTEYLDRLLIERMIEQVVGAGVGDPGVIAEAAPWRAVTHPGAVWGPARTVVWWHFADIGEVGQRTVWDRDEVRALAEAGCVLDESATAMRLAAAAWERPLHHAGERLLLVRPTVAAGEAVGVHPLWHGLAAGRKGLDARIGFRAETILADIAPTFAGRVLKRRKIEGAALPASRTEWSAPPATIGARDFESASSLSVLLGCPFGWTLQYSARVRGSARQSLPGSDAIFGTLAHIIAEQLFEPGAPPDPDIAAQRARVLLEEALPQAAATLLLPGEARALAEARSAVPEALAELARFLRANKLKVVATEKGFEDPSCLGADTGLRGSIDLLAADANDRPVVFDLKWQRTDKYRRAEISDGVSIQLAAYAKHMDPAIQSVETGYFMLRQKRFITGSQRFVGPVLTVDGNDMHETWKRIDASWKGAMAELATGKVRATYEALDRKDFADPVLMTPPKCGFCDYSVLCGRS